MPIGSLVLRGCRPLAADGSTGTWPDVFLRNTEQHCCVWLPHYQLPVQSRWTHRGVLTGRALTRPWDGMAVGLDAQARALALLLPWNVVAVLGNGHHLPPQTFLRFCLSVCDLPSFKAPCDFRFSVSLARPRGRVGSAVMGQGSMRKGLSSVPLSSGPTRAWLPRVSFFLNGGGTVQGWVSLHRLVLC